MIGKFTWKENIGDWIIAIILGIISIFIGDGIKRYADMATIEDILQTFIYDNWPIWIGIGVALLYVGIRALYRYWKNASKRLFDLETLMGVDTPQGGRNIISVENSLKEESGQMNDKLNVEIKEMRDTFLNLIIPIWKKVGLLEMEAMTPEEREEFYRKIHILNKRRNP